MECEQGSILELNFSRNFMFSHFVWFKQPVAKSRILSSIWYGCLGLTRAKASVSRQVWANWSVYIYITYSGKGYWMFMLNFMLNWLLHTREWLLSTIIFWVFFKRHHTKVLIIFCRKTVLDRPLIFPDGVIELLC